MSIPRRRFITLCGATVGAIALTPALDWRRRVQAQPVHAAPERKQIMVEQMTKSTFEPYLNTPFWIQATPDQTVTVTLVEVSGKSSDGTLEQFSLLFEGPRETLLPQKIYAFDHAEMGQFELFIVPVLHTNQSKFYYQAAFSRI